MQKTKLGVTVGLLGAAIYILSHFAGYLALILLVGYVLLCEQNEWLRRTAVKAAVLKVLFSLVYAAINLLPTAVNFFDSFAGLFEKDVTSPFVTNMTSMLTISFNVFEMVLFLILGFMALKQRTIRFGFIDRFVNKVAAREEPVYWDPRYRGQ